MEKITYVNKVAYNKALKDYQYKKERRDLILSARQKGYKQKQIAFILNVSRQRVQQIEKQEIKKPDIKFYTNVVVKKVRPLKWFNPLLEKTKTKELFLKTYGRERTRFLVRLRDNFTCQDCGLRRTPQESVSTGKKQFDVHHLLGLCGKKSRAYDKVGEIDGLITLCHRCHYNRPEHTVKRGCG